MNTKTKLALSIVSLAILVVGLAGCQPKVVRPNVSPTAPPSVVDTTGAIQYKVDSQASDVHILVYRGGAMARLGHNHVVSSKNVSGTLLLNRDLARSRLELTLPVPSLIVDDPKTRTTEGTEFTAEVPQEAREGTLHNLLQPEMLDADHFPAITLQSVAITGTRDNPSLLMRITIKDVSRDVVVLALVKEENDRVVAEGEFSIQQSDFGITPFSVALGTLQVQDRLQIKFRIVAVKQS